ncbi:MAG TPA: HAMP domain-containing sensor histidine kinase, partial [Methylomirabilota bacterium]
MKLRLRLVLLLMLPLLLVIGLYSVVRVQQESRARVQDERLRADGMARTIQIAVESALAVRGREQGELVDLLNDMTHGQPSIDQIRIFGRDGHLLAASQDQAAAHPANPEAVARVIESGAAEFVETHGPARWVYIMPVPSPPLNGRAPSTAARRALEITFVAPTIEKMASLAIRDVFVRVGSLTVVLALLITVVLQRQVLRPLANLAQSIRALGEGRRGPPLPVERHDELGELAETFNRMAEQLEEARRRLVAEAEYALDLEQQLRRSETLAVAGKLASGIAHEVGTPLNIISGRAEILLRSLPPDDPGRQDLERIIHQIDRVSNIVRSLLDTVRVGKLEIQRVPVETLISRLLPLLEHVVRKRGIAMTTDIPANVPNIAGDPGRLQQVFINILMNAVEATPADGRISIRAWPSANDGRAGVTVEVADTGAGIPAENLPHLFDRFWQARKERRGAGLGLAIVKGIVEAHGGRIWVQSAPGQGSTFHFS